MPDKEDNIEKNSPINDGTPQIKNVLLVDDHPIVMYGLSLLIDQEDDLHVCGQCGSAVEALDTIDKYNPDVAVVDISLHGSNGLELTKALKEIRPSLPILILSMHDESLYAERALRAGARGYIMKQESAEKVLDAIRTVVNGSVYLSKKLSNRILREFADGTKAEPNDKYGIDTLSDRELEIFEFIGRGQSSRDIANRLQLSIKTIETHRAHIKQKLKIDTATELVHHAFHWVESGSTN